MASCTKVRFDCSSLCNLGIEQSKNRPASRQRALKSWESASAAGATRHRCVPGQEPVGTHPPRSCTKSLRCSVGNRRSLGRLVRKRSGPHNTCPDPAQPQSRAGRPSGSVRLLASVSRLVKHKVKGNHCVQSLNFERQPFLPGSKAATTYQHRSISSRLAYPL